MKTFLVFCVVLVAGIHAKFVSPFPPQYDQIVFACRVEHGYTDNVVAEEEESYFAENKGLRIVNYCFLEKTGFVTSDGELNIEEALDNFPPGSVKDTIEDCKNLQKEKNYPRTVFSTCFHAHIVYNLRISQSENIIESQYENFLDIVEDCRDETGYTDEVIAEEENSNLDLDTGLKKFNNCFLDKTGFRNEKKFELDDALKKIPQHIVTEITKFCQSKIEQGVFTDDTPYISACLHQGASNYIRKTEVQLLAHSETDQVASIVHDCKEDTGFHTSLFYNLGGKFDDEEGLKKFNDCFLEKTGFVTSDGELDIDAGLAELSPGFAKPIVEHCQANILLNYIAEDFEDFSACYQDGILNHISEGNRVGYRAFKAAWKVFVPGTAFIETVFTPGPMVTFFRLACLGRSYNLAKKICPSVYTPLSHTAVDSMVTHWKPDLINF